MRKLTLVLICAALAAPTLGLVLGGTNFGVSGYPEPGCVAPYRPEEVTEDFQAELYAQDLQFFTDCIRDYVENAHNDIQRIQEAIETAHSMGEGGISLLEVDPVESNPVGIDPVGIDPVGIDPLDSEGIDPDVVDPVEVDPFGIDYGEVEAAEDDPFGE